MLSVSEFHCFHLFLRESVWYIHFALLQLTHLGKNKKKKQKSELKTKRKEDEYLHHSRDDRCVDWQVQAERENSERQ